jgi:hypothetical protein
MTPLSPRSQVTTAVLDKESGDSPLACPMCHTPTSLTHAAVDAGADWRCVRCGQHFDAARLAAMSAYAEWVAERAAGTGRSQRS